MSIVFDFKAIKSKLPSIIEGGDNHYPVAQPMAVEVTGQVVGEPNVLPVNVSVDANGDLVVAEDYSHVYGDFSGLTGSDGRAWTYNSYEDRWEHRPQDGSLIVSFVRPAGDSITCSDGHVWTYDAAEQEWVTVNEWGVKSTSFTKPA
jgi:hypothetical protein